MQSRLTDFIDLRELDRSIEEARKNEDSRRKGFASFTDGNVRVGFFVQRFDVMDYRKLDREIEKARIEQDLRRQQKEKSAPYQEGEKGFVFM